MPARSDAPSKALKVLFMPAWYPSKHDPILGIFVREHARALAPYCDVAVLYSSLANITLKGWYVISSDRIEEGIHTVRVHYRRSPIPKSTYFIYLWSVIGAFRTLAREGFKPDVIHAHVFTAGVPAVILGRLFRIPVVITEQWTGFPSRKLTLRDRILARFAMNKATVILPVSEDLRQHIESYGVNARFRVVPNVVNTELFYPSPNGVRRDTDAKKLLCVALLMPKKGIPYLLKALDRLKDERDDFILDIVGDGPKRPEYEQMTAELGLSDRVKFHGLKSKPQVAEFMRRCDFFVLPSLWENLPCVVMEALASGKPVVASKVGGIPEMIRDEVGRLVPPQDVDALAQAIDYMLDHYQGYSSEQIAQYARERYGYEVVGHKMYQIYEQCIGR